MKHIIGLQIILVFLIACKTDPHSHNTEDELNHDHHHHGNSEWYEVYEAMEYAQVADSCWIKYTDESFQNMLYSFDFTGFNTKQIAKNFEHDISIDSLILEDVPGYPYYLYRFHNKNSRFDFLVKSFGSEDYYFIDRAQLSSNILKFKNGLSIGMTKEQFSLAMGYKMPICDIFRVSDGDLASDYDFIFVNNKLDRIIIWEAH